MIEFGQSLPWLSWQTVLHHALLLWTVRLQESISKRKGLRTRTRAIIPIYVMPRPGTWCSPYYASSTILMYSVYPPLSPNSACYGQGQSLIQNHLHTCIVLHTLLVAKQNLSTLSSSIVGSHLQFHMTTSNPQNSLER